MRLTRHTPVLDAVKSILRSMSGSYEFTLDAFEGGISALAGKKLQHGLIDRDRPFLKVTPELAIVATRALGQAFREVLSKNGNVRVEYLLQQVGLAVRVWVAYRFEAQGGDVSLRALKPATVEAKARKSQDPRIGFATGKLNAAIRRSPFRLRKVR